MKSRLLAIIMGMSSIAWIGPVEATESEANFAMLNRLVSESVKLAQDIKSQIGNASPRDIDRLKIEYFTELKRATDCFGKALSLANENDDKKEVMNARLFYAYTNFWLRKNYEAAVLADYVARTASKDDVSLAMDGAYLAMAAFVQVFSDNKAPIAEKSEDMGLIIKACKRIADRWPSSEKANEAYTILGRMYSTQKKPAEAAQWFGKVPPTDPKFPEAQINAGQAYWTAYLNSVRIVGPEEPTAEQLAAWMKAAQDHLKTGIDALTKTVPANATPSELIAAKLSLSQIIISQGKDAEASKLLLDDPHSVIKAVTVADEATRPETGITSRKFATECYKLLLRSYIGAGDLKNAVRTHTVLSEICAASGDLTFRGDLNELRSRVLKLIRAESDFLDQNEDVARSERLNRLIEEFGTCIKSDRNQVEK